MTRAESKCRPGRSSSWITKHKRLAIYVRDGFSCQYCGRDMRNAAPRELTLDHLRCRIDGGTNEATNLILACGTCNSARGARVVWYRYATGGAVLRIRRTIRRKLNTDLAKSIIEGTISREQALAESAR
jgi:hypothetical protein